MPHRSVSADQSSFRVGDTIIVAGALDGEREAGVVMWLQDCGTHVRMCVLFAKRGKFVWRLPGGGEGEELADEQTAPPVEPVGEPMPPAKVVKGKR